MRKAYQYRYIKNNMYPEDIVPAQLVTGSAFADKTPIYQLGIQSFPGTKFYLNGGTDPIIIGTTGIYELDLQEKATITALRFASDSIKIITNALENAGGFLIVDIVYEGEEE